MAYDQALIRQALQETKGMIFLAAKRVGCSYQAIYHMLNRDPDLKEFLNGIRGEMLDYTELKLYTAISRDERWAIEYYLDTMGKERGYVRRQEHTGEDGKDITIRVIYGDKGTHSQPS